MSSFIAKNCPFCKKDNNCEIKLLNKCWCMNIEVPQQLKDLVLEDVKMKSCICKNCIESFKKNPDKFIEKYTFI